MPDTCPFCNPDPDQVFHESDLVIGLWDRYPVSPGHALLVPRRHVADWFDAIPEEQQALTAADRLESSAAVSTRAPFGRWSPTPIPAVVRFLVNARHRRWRPPIFSPTPNPVPTGQKTGYC